MKKIVMLLLCTMPLVCEAVVKKMEWMNAEEYTDQEIASRVPPHMIELTGGGIGGRRRQYPDKCFKIEFDGQDTFFMTVIEELTLAGVSPVFILSSGFRKQHIVDLIEYISNPQTQCHGLDPMGQFWIFVPLALKSQIQWMDEICKEQPGVVTLTLEDHLGHRCWRETLHHFWARDPCS